MNPKSGWPKIGLVLAAFLVGLSQACLGQAGDSILEAPDSEPLPTPVVSGVATLFQNVRIFDGKTAALSAPSDVLVRGNTIERISASSIAVDTTANVRVIAANGRVLMPGLIDAHWHAFMAGIPLQLLITSPPSYLHLLAARQAEATLMRGFTTVRDCGGPVFGLKRAIDEGVTIGPRIYPSGAFTGSLSRQDGPLYTAAEALKMATADDGELMALSGLLTLILGSLVL